MSQSRKTWRVGQIRRHVTALHGNARAAARYAQEQARLNTSPDSSPERYAGDHLRQGAEKALRGVKMTGSQVYRIVARKRRAMQTREPSIPEPIVPEAGSVGGDSVRPQTPRRGASPERVHSVQRSRETTRRRSAATAASGRPWQQGVQSSAQIRKNVSQTAKSATRQTSGIMARRSAKVAQKAAKQAVSSRANTKAAAKSAKQAAKIAAKTVKGMIQATKNMVVMIAAGGWVALVVIIIICLVGLLISSVFGIFFGNDIRPEDGLTVRQAVAEVNREYYDKITEITGSISDLNMSEVKINGSLSGNLRDTWKDVLAVYAVQMHQQDYVMMIDDVKLDKLRTVFWDMVSISHRTTPVYLEEEQTNPETGEKVTVVVTKHNLYIDVTAKRYTDMISVYGLSEEQQDLLKELTSPQYDEEWRRLLYGAAGGNQSIVEVALSQVGNVGGQPYWSWYGFNYRIEWCACFVSWCANECGFIDAGIIPKFSSCTSQGRAWFQSHGQWQEPGYVPSPGEIIFFDWDLSGNCDHVGIVEKVEGNTIYTIEGNSGDKVKRKSYAVDYGCIAGYGCPAFE